MRKSKFLGRRVSIFIPSYEAWNLFLPLFVIPLVFYFIVPSSGHDLQRRMFGYFVAGAIFLNWSHTAFTIGAFLELKGFRNFIQSKSNLKFRFFKTRTFFLYFLFLIFSFFCYLMNSNNQSFLKVFNTKNLMFWINIYGIYHVSRQFAGLSLLYNRNFEKQNRMSPRELTRFFKQEKIERFLFKIWIWSQVIYTFILWFHSEKIPWLDTLFLYTLRSTTILILLNSILMPQASRSNKSLYLLRLGLCAFVPSSLFSVLYFMSIHGIEYYFIARTFFDKEPRVKTIFGIGRISFALSLTHLLMWLNAQHPMGNYLYRWYNLPRESIPFPLVIIGTFAAATHLIHFYLDGIIFRFRDSAVREHISPLLQIPRNQLTPLSSSHPNLLLQDKI